jgi:hypothetical protein
MIKASKLQYVLLGKIQQNDIWTIGWGGGGHAVKVGTIQGHGRRSII